MELPQSVFLQVLVTHRECGPLSHQQRVSVCSRETLAFWVVCGSHFKVGTFVLSSVTWSVKLFWCMRVSETPLSAVDPAMSRVAVPSQGSLAGQAGGCPPNVSSPPGCGRKPLSSVSPPPCLSSSGRVWSGPRGQSH